MNDKKVELSVELVNGILAYLQNKPYNEVNAIFNRVQAELETQLENKEVTEE